MKVKKLDFNLFLILFGVVAFLGVLTSAEIVYSIAEVNGDSFSLRGPQSVAQNNSFLENVSKSTLFKVVKLNCKKTKHSKNIINENTKFVSIEGKNCIKGLVKNFTVKNLTNKIDGVGFVLANNKIKTDYIYMSQGENLVNLKFTTQGIESVYNISIRRKKTLE